MKYKITIEADGERVWLGQTEPEDISEEGILEVVSGYLKGISQHLAKEHDCENKKCHVQGLATIISSAMLEVELAHRNMESEHEH